jgi:hypothetical protein
MEKIGHLLTPMLDRYEAAILEALERDVPQGAALDRFDAIGGSDRTASSARMNAS